MQDVLHFQSLQLKTDVWLGHYQHAFDSLKGRDLLILTDENVAKYHMAVVERFPHIIIPAGEESKSFSMLEHVLSELLRLKAGRETVLVGFGGGVITDLAGFAAGIYKRGIDFVSMPTSLLGMTDASVGGKNGINFGGFKNQVGTIIQPTFTWIDTSFLKTLPYLQFLNGLAELVKSSLIFPGKAWAYLNEHQEKLMKTHPLVLKELLSEAVQNKLQIVERDEFDTGERQMLNFGHTFGHAVESKENMLHGLAVSKGMIASLKLSVAAGIMPLHTAKEIVSLIENLGLPVQFEFKPEYFVYIEEDKKRLKDAVNFVFLKEPGVTERKQIKLNELKSLAYDARDIAL